MAELSIYENQARKQAQINELMTQTAPAPVLMPCFTIFRRPCRQGRKMVGIVERGGANQFIGFYDSTDDLLNCLAIGNSYAGHVGRLHVNVAPADNMVGNEVRGKLIFRFTIPDFVALEKRRRPGTTVNYVW